MHGSKIFAIFSSLAIMASSTQIIGAANVTPTVSSSTSTISGSTLTGDKQHVRVGLALGGGGARGAAHVGVLKVLLEEGVPIDVIAGTSIGSVVGGLYSAGVSPEELSKDFQDGKLMKEFTPMPLTLRIVLAPVIFIPRLLGSKPYDGLYSGKKFRKYMDSLVSDSNRNIENMHIPFCAVCTNLVTGESQHISKGDVGQALQASTAVPGLRKPVEIDGKLFCDGGLINNVPVSHARELGADFVIAVDIDERMNSNEPLASFRKVGSVSRQALKIQLHDSDHILRKDADFVIHPNTDGISLISRKSKDGQAGVQAGIDAAKAAMPELKRKLASLGVQLATKDTSSVK
jgi:NTE family protein